MTPDDDNARRRALSPILSTDDFHPLSSSVQVDWGACSAPGRGRPGNEDHFLVVRLAREQTTLATSLADAEVPNDFAEYGYAMLVADGLGEGGVGSVASRIALSTIAHLALHFGKWNLRIDPQTASDLFDRAEWYYCRADEAIIARSHAEPILAGMATALTAAYSAGTDLVIAHVGHTRAYLFRDGALTLLTRDHTVERHLADIGTPVAIERRARDLQHILTDAVGASADYPLVEVERFTLQDGDAVLLCSNGLTDTLGEERVADVLALRRQSPEQCQTLINMAAASSDDDATAILAQYRIPGLSSDATAPPPLG
jgi:protein phosphatase